jgi:hypothetical protein
VQNAGPFTQLVFKGVSLKREGKMKVFLYFLI